MQPSEMNEKECKKQETSTKSSLFSILFVVSETPFLIYSNPDFNINF